LGIKYSQPGNKTFPAWEYNAGCKWRDRWLLESVCDAIKYDYYILRDDE
jgi:hypothetical protein